MSTDDLKDFSMLGLFLMEAETQAQVLNEGLLQLEKEPTASGGLETLMRAAHSLKGGARIIQADMLVKFAHAMEDYFVAVINRKITIAENHIDQLLNGVDLLKMLAETPEAAFETTLNEHQTELERLAGIYQKLTAPVAPAAPEPAPPAAPPPTPPVAAIPPGAPVAAPTATAPPRPVSAHDHEPTTKGGPGKENFVKVAAPKMERLMGLAGEALVYSKKMQDMEKQLLRLRQQVGQLQSLGQQLSLHAIAGHHDEWEDFQRRFHDLDWSSTELSNGVAELTVMADNFGENLYQEVISCKIMPFGDLAKMFPRMVRDVAKKLGKKVNFEISGEKTGLDRDILELLEAPIDHLLRNALDHGLETPDERLAAGKPPEGTIKLSAFHWAGMFNITITDDGRGIDLENLKRHIISKDLATEEMLNAMPRKELLDFLFLPGFSTRNTVSEFSGRGVGLDVVMNMVQEVKGSINIETELGKYTTFHLRLPITLSIISAMIVEIGEELYAIPSTRIDRLLVIASDRIQTLEGHQYIRYDDTNIGIVSGREILGYPLQELDREQIPLVIMSDRESSHAMIVDRLRGEAKLVVRPLDERLGKIPGVAAAAILDDGTPVLIADVDDIVRAIDGHIKNNSLHHLNTRSDQAENVQRKNVLVIDDSITVRELEKQILESHGYQVETAVNGVDGWNAVRTAHFDIVITDLDMPRMNGFELVEKIKNHPTLKNLPVMIVSYKDREEDRLRGVELGADYYLTKSSFHDNTMLDAVYQLIGEATP